MGQNWIMEAFLCTKSFCWTSSIGLLYFVWPTDEPPLRIMGPVVLGNIIVGSLKAIDVVVLPIGRRDWPLWTAWKLGKFRQNLIVPSKKDIIMYLVTLYPVSVSV